MALDVKRKLRQTGQALLLSAGLLSSGAGCSTFDRSDKQAGALNGEKPAPADPAVTARSQGPGVVTPPANTPVITPASVKDETSSARFQGDAHVRIVATIGTKPIYEREVHEAVYQRLPELMRLSPREQIDKKKSMFNEELRRIIERELILDELFAMLEQKKQTAAINQLKESASKDADARLKDIQKRFNIPNEDELKLFFQSQGLTLAGVRRHFERSFMMSAYLGERLKPKLQSVSLAEVRDYYDANPKEFLIEDRVKWQDLFVRSDHFRSQDDARKYAEWLLARGNQGDDFMKLVEEFDKGDSKSRGGMGYGEEKGKIFPPEIEPVVFALKEGQCSLVEFESGFHVVRVAERTYAGKRPFDEKTQTEARRKVMGIVSDRELKKILADLWRKFQPEILVD